MARDFGQTRPKQSCLVIMHSSTFADKRIISAQTPHTNCQLRGGGLMIWACFVATGPGHRAVIESTMNSSVYQSILASSISLTAKACLKLGHATGQ